MLSVLKAKIKAIWDKVNSDISELWAKDKGFVIAFGVLILIVKFRDILISLLVSNGKSLFEKAQVQNDKLQKQENAANDEANKLRDQANQLSNSNTSVGDDWNTKQ